MNGQIRYRHWIMIVWVGYGTNRHATDPGLRHLKIDSQRDVWIAKVSLRKSVGI